MLQWALKYLSLGFSVIPLESRGKKPLIPWTEFQKRRASEKEVLDWWNKWPNANLGLVTGAVSGVIVIDLDGPEGISQASLMKLSSSVISLTGDGKHLWYSTDGNVLKQIANAVRIAPGIDIRGEGGYVVVSPSIHESGRRYRWLNGGFQRHLLPEPPKIFSEFISMKFQKPFGGVSQIKEQSWIAKALQEMTNGNIDSTLFTVCSRLRADGYSRHDASTLLRPHAIAAGAIEGHLEDKIDNVWSRYTPNEKRISNSPITPQSEEVSNSETVEDFMAGEDEVSWLAPGLIANSSFGFAVGLPETNKTWALMDLAIEASRGGMWLGVFPTKLSKVWFIDQERFRGETKRRFKAMLAAKGLRAGDLTNLRVNSGNTNFKIDLDQSFTAFRKRIEETRPDLVIIDSLATFHTKEENNRTEIQRVLERIKSLRNEFGCTFLLIHHENKLSFQSKEEGKEPSLAEMSGNIAIPAAAETVLTFRKRIDDSSLVYHVKSTMSKRHRPFEVRVTDLNGPNAIEVKGYL